MVFDLRLIYALFKWQRLDICLAINFGWHSPVERYEKNQKWWSNATELVDEGTPTGNDAEFHSWLDSTRHDSYFPLPWRCPCHSSCFLHSSFPISRHLFSVFIFFGFLFFFFCFDGRPSDQALINFLLNGLKGAERCWPAWWAALGRVGAGGQGDSRCHTSSISSPFFMTLSLALWLNAAAGGSRHAACGMNGERATVCVRWWTFVRDAFRGLALSYKKNSKANICMSARVYVCVK